MGWEERVTNRHRGGVMVMMRRMGWQGNSEWRAGKSRKHLLVSDDCLMVDILKAQMASVRCYSHLSAFHPLLTLPWLPLFSSSRSFIFSNPLLRQIIPLSSSIIFSFHLTPPVSIHSLPLPWRPSCSSPHWPVYLFALALPFLAPKLWLCAHKARGVKIEFWLNESLDLHPQFVSIN